MFTQLNPDDGKNGLLYKEKQTANQGIYLANKMTQMLQMLFSKWQFSLANSETNLIKKLFSCRIWLDGELQLRVHGGDSDIDLENGIKQITLN